MTTSAYQTTLSISIGINRSRIKFSHFSRCLCFKKVGLDIFFQSVKTKMKLLVFACILGFFAGGVTSISSDVGAFMKHLEVIPDVISEAPKDFLTVSTLEMHCIHNGTE